MKTQRAKKKLVCGVGINDANYLVQPIINGKCVPCLYYRAWTNMLNRAYCKKHHEKSPTYIGVSVCKEWHSFMEFKEWMRVQDWEGNALDKDIILQGNKIYSPELCAFVDQSVNSLLLCSDAKRGNLPLGVSFCNTYKKYKSSIGAGKLRIWSEYFTDVELAHRAWQKNKAEAIEKVAAHQKDSRIKSGLMLRVNQLREDILNNRETIKL